MRSEAGIFTLIARVPSLADLLYLVLIEDQQHYTHKVAA